MLRSIKKAYEIIKAQDNETSITIHTIRVLNYDEVIEALRSGWITTGPRTKLLERRLAAYIETGRVDVDTESEPDRWKDRVVCLNSATAAEELNLRILGIHGSLPSLLEESLCIFFGNYIRVKPSQHQTVISHTGSEGSPCFLDKQIVRRLKIAQNFICCTEKICPRR